MPKAPLISSHFNAEAGQRLTAALSKFPRQMRDDIMARYKAEATMLKETMQKRSSEGPLFKRKGRLRRSWSDNLDGGLRIHGITAIVGSAASYSVIHEEGGRVYPQQQSKFIWIPQPGNLKSNRTAKVSPTEARRKIEGGQWRFAVGARDSGDDNRAAVLNEDGDRMYLLVRNIYIPPRLGFAGQGQRAGFRLTSQLEHDVIAYWDAQARRIQSTS